MLIKGSDLSEKQKQLVLNAFIYRWTSDNRQRESSWSGIDGQPTIPLITDEEWLADHAFHFVRDGSHLSEKRHCEPSYIAD